MVGVTLKYYSTIHQNSSKYNWERGQRHRSEELLLLLSACNSDTGFILYRTEVSCLAEARQLAAEVSQFMGVPLAVYLPPQLQ